MSETPFLRLVSAQRTRVLRGSGIAVLIVVLFSQNRLPADGLLDSLFDYLGFVLVMVCAFGRLWASMYICGYKTTQMITEGPYSMVRNPLYLFSLAGGVGLGLATGSLAILAVILIVYVGIYPFVINAEERTLLDRHGEAFREYANSTPRFIPDLSRLRDADSYPVNVAAYRKYLVESAGFPLMYLLIEIIEALHRAGWLPVLFTIP